MNLVFEHMKTEEKKKAYEKVKKALALELSDKEHWVTKMATINCELKTHLPYYFWVGFYIYYNGELIVGPYQGTHGCLHIAIGRGVCGTAAKEGKTQIVPDVTKFPGYIACDSESKSEIVVPVFGKEGTLVAVFDMDSTELGSFDGIDQQYLEALLSTHFASETVLLPK